MACKNCGSDRILGVNGKTDDRTAFDFKGEHINGTYVPRDLQLGGGDYLRFDLCLECGKVQGDFPADDPEFFQNREMDDDPDEDDDLDEEESDEESTFFDDDEDDD